MSSVRRVEYHRHFLRALVAIGGVVAMVPFLVELPVAARDEPPSTFHPQ